MKPIEVQMFGSFSMKYEDRLITGKAKTSESQFNYLMQLLIHAGAEGVPKNVLISTIFGGRDLNNPNHAVHSVIYNAKKHLETFGIPAKNAIYQKDGVYYWNEELPVEEDARRFEELAVRAAETSDRSEAIQLYMDAIHLYVGDFLESGTSNPWIAKESYRYRKLFTKTVTETADLLRLTGQYLVMEDLGKFAAKVHPFSDWETLTMEAYVAEGKAEEANALFEKTVELYLNEQGIRPSNRLFGLVNTLSD
ncbi:MAG: bacterial transcriptional activator domain-containing protein [Lachnospiraceae bacterium]|nr:bacterial transcriptional activator domain-containing protein [Lachnospiraceae bacterium]